MRVVMRCLASIGVGFVFLVFSVLAGPLSSHAAESTGQCFILLSGSGEEAWDGPKVADLGQCAALAAEQAAASESEVGKSRWQDIDIQANSDGSFEAFRAGALQWRGFWDVDKLVTSVADDIGAFWSREFESRGWTYEAPARVQGYTRRIRTACGRAVLDNAFYCRISHSIYYDSNLLREQFGRVGDFAPTVVIAHEWGHAIQSLRIARGTRQRVLRLEQQADCFAGAYVRDANARAILREGDVDEARALFGYLPGRRNTHGTPEQRLSAFDKGFEGGVEACLDV
jgi:predicted metalloprotease